MPASRYSISRSIGGMLSFSGAGHCFLYLVQAKNGNSRHELSVLCLTAIVTLTLKPSNKNTIEMANLER